ncbi:TPA: HlyD family secretion protein [Elizabethkingia anophelis]|uniref:HlyD family secretion protein n=1 Tax=Elizabethkingia anophelis TaxID=1117645 RepID=UPI001627B19E|nr:HlyD family secretion protein [Elizabethkingia anophelis]MCT4321253.1 HlyD family secretion protein [Elizabethkingia anophelis]HAY3534179.1 HlyD family secretion protein [Elizabethkingia anophelis]HAY3537201.1 HlyD family secretion protein [Elizabethkingia anophelis]HAY3546295.1 HlyD family secretion protein [Elizabethkingia anophelis]HAY3549440.1 HlyD family secretion protein [Elizabethkingia anophelis]
MSEQVPNKKKINSKFIAILAVLIVGGGAFGFYKYQHAQVHQTTDDAQIETNITAITPRIQAFIKEVRVKDNQYVKKGDTLLILDASDINTKVEEARAGVSQAESGITAAQAQTEASTSTLPITNSQVAAMNANIDAAKAKLWQATQDYNRYSILYQDHSITKQQFEQARTAMLEAQATVKGLESQRLATQNQTQATISQSHAVGSQVSVAKANLEKSKASLEAAKINLSYTVITAPVSGYVSRVDLQQGQLLNPGQQLFNIVDEHIWVVANFKETQLEKMRIGQKVEIKADAYPNHKFEAKIGSFSPATGAQFSLLPPDNASGNFVKVVQRLPVSIEFVNPKDPMLKYLRPGMNLDVDVTTK